MAGRRGWSGHSTDSTATTSGSCFTCLQPSVSAALSFEISAVHASVSQGSVSLNKTLALSTKPLKSIKTISKRRLYTQFRLFFPLDRIAMEAEALGCTSPYHLALEGAQSIDITSSSRGVVSSLLLGLVHLVELWYSLSSSVSK
jgi:hypothetical protein